MELTLPPPLAGEGVPDRAPVKSGYSASVLTLPLCYLSFVPVLCPPSSDLHELVFHPCQSVPEARSTGVWKTPDRVSVRFAAGQRRPDQGHGVHPSRRTEFIEKYFEVVPRSSGARLSVATPRLARAGLSDRQLSDSRKGCDEALQNMRST